MNGLARCVAILGTGSDVGKSVVAAAICRVFSDMGVKVSPFKTQNMSNNSFVTYLGEEMGRAQVVQAECARIEPNADMNPILVKPSGNKCQIVLRGKVSGAVPSSEFKTEKKALFDKALESLDRLRREYDLIVIEGAGSCAEMNLLKYDLANFRTALACDASVILVADISRGGVFAQVLGTLNLLTDEERRMVKGIVINRFRGDVSLFDDGVAFIENNTGLPVLGVIPNLAGLDIDAEDSVSLESITDPPAPADSRRVNIAALRLPHISNFTDFNTLIREKQVNFSYLRKPRDLAGVDAIILPGSKNTRADMAWLRDTGWDAIITDYHKNGGRVVGVCGGYQMLGKRIEDPDGVEGDPGYSDGLGLLDVTTRLLDDKRLTRITGVCRVTGARLEGYEIHMGVTERGESVRPLFDITDHTGNKSVDGAIGDDGVWGAYIHGVFDSPEYRKSFLKSLGKEIDETAICDVSPAEYRQAQYDVLADHFRKHINMESLMKIAGLAGVTP